ncbi:hypothetical protein K7432_002095 [Basidiobolus ranarum]|uniref:Cytochrome P450 n=1 Tax=Basidiobolus ranarum TaxID=34480 RepID=A0ABR2X219_9FUNG
MLLVISIICAFTLLVWVKHFKKSPYSQLPGPKEHPLFGNVLQIRLDHILKDFETWAWEHGPIFRLNLLSRQALVVSDTQMINDILKARPEGFSRGENFANQFKEFDVHAVFTLEDTEWKHARYWVAMAFTPAKVRQYTKCIWHNSKKLMEKLTDLSATQKALLQERSLTPSLPAETISHRHIYKDNDMTESIITEIQSAILSIICGLSFSWGDKDFLSPAVLDDCKVLLSRMFERALCLIPFWKIYPTERDIIAKNTSSMFRKRIQTLMDKEYKLPDQDKGETRTFLESLLRCSQDESNQSSKAGAHPLSDEQIKANLLIVVIAGYETTSSVMRAVLYELAIDVEYQERVRQEVQKAFGNVRELDIENDIEIVEQVANAPEVHVPLIMAFMQEILRIHSPASLLLLSSRKDQMIQGVHITKGTDIYLLTRVATFRSWPNSNPWKFDPAQWLSEDKEQIKAMKSVDLSFGNGPRVCPGRHLAEKELVILISLIVANFRISVIDTPPHVGSVTEKFWFIPYVTNLHIRLEPI